MKTITIIVDDNGMIDEVLVSKDIANDVVVNVIDFCTDDPDEVDDATMAYSAIKESGDYVSVY